MAMNYLFSPRKNHPRENSAVQEALSISCSNSVAQRHWFPAISIQKRQVPFRTKTDFDITNSWVIFWDFSGWYLKFWGDPSLIHLQMTVVHEFSHQQTLSARNCEKLCKYDSNPCRNGTCNIRYKIRSLTTQELGANKFVGALFSHSKFWCNPISMFKHSKW